MTPLPPVTRVRLRSTHRLVPSRYPPVGILDTVSRPEDLDLIIELESWTNDRVSGELGLLHTIPRGEWVMGRPMASVVMAAFCHPRPGGGRFNDETRGAWYGARTLETAHAEAVYHRTRELAEVGVLDTRVEMRLYLADFNARFHDLRGGDRAFAACYAPDSYAASQQLARALLDAGSNGLLCRSVRDPKGECLAAFRPPLVLNVRPGAHFEYRWSGSLQPAIRRLG
jgi:hypothetical protein